ncbi:MAG: MupA/Atu3671 family FMN-dependent luciferase-like monooxygenase [Acidobacteriota bacterium]
MDFGILFFSSVPPAAEDDKYALLIEAAKLADRLGFRSVWIPERHFHEFGGLFPNPSVLGAALAMITERIEIRAGSLISPLHHTLRIAEEWAVLDNLSGGRVAISFGSGWNVDDFIFFPERYASRRAVMLEQIEIVRRLWAGGTHVATNSFGKEVEVRLYPRPLQESLPVWVTSSGNAETFADAGAIGANILTHLLGQDLETLRGKIDIYRSSLAGHGFDPAAGRVSLMLHTFMAPDTAAVKEKVRGPFREYLRSAISLEQMAAAGGGAISGGHRIDPHSISPEVLSDLLDLTFERYFRSASLLGSPADLQPLVLDLEEIGVDEIACLIDFLDDPPAVLESLRHVDALRASTARGARESAVLEQVSHFLDDLESEGSGA